MKSIYLEKKQSSIAYFIGNFKEEDDDFVEIDGNTAIEKSAFAYSDVEKLLFKNCSPDIGEKAFEGCGELTTVIFGELGNDETIEEEGEEKVVIKNLTLASTASASASGDFTIQANAFNGCESLTTVIFGKLGNDDEKVAIKNLTLASAGGNFTIQANAFNGCENLTTLVLPDVEGTLTIEKDAFCGCGALRTVVVLCDKIDFTDNPFADEAEHLTFICKKDSAVARFARENGYRSVYVG